MGREQMTCTSHKQFRQALDLSKPIGYCLDISFPCNFPFYFIKPGRGFLDAHVNERTSLGPHGKKY